MMTIIRTLTCCLIVGLVATVAKADEKTDTEAPRDYAHDFEGQDLTKQKFDKKNLDNSNFTDADLTGTSFDGASMKNCNFRGARLSGTSFTTTDLTGSDFREATFERPFFIRAVLNKCDFSDVDLKATDLVGLKMREAIFRNTVGFNQIYGADFYMADLRGADLSAAIDFTPSNFRKAKSDQFTRWFDGFDVKARGLTVVETKDEPADAEKHADEDKASRKPAAKPSKPSKPKTNDPEAEFQKLDSNEDGVLSGKEKKGFESRDANEDGEVTLAEFIAGAEE